MTHKLLYTCKSATSALLILFGLLLTTPIFAQTPVAPTPAPAPATPPAPAVTIGGYVGTYYAWDNDNSVGTTGTRQFSFIAPKRDQFGLDIASLTGKYATDKVRATATLQFGDVVAGWPDKSNIQEANAGFLFADNFWVDAGLFLTHIGAESPFPKDNYLSSLALVTYSEPFAQSGLRFSYTFSDKLSGQLHLLNGYNQFSTTSPNKSVGIQLDYKPSETVELLYNDLLGNVAPDHFRFYNNFVGKYTASPKVDVLVGLDFATQSKSKLTDSTATGSAFGALATVRFKPSAKFAVTARLEYLSDEDGFLYGTGAVGTSTSGYKTFGGTVGVTYQALDNAFVRLESRYLSFDSNQKIFSDGTTTTNSRVEVLFTTGVTF
jgi:hypothetical protein